MLFKVITLFFPSPISSFCPRCPSSHVVNLIFLLHYTIFHSPSFPSISYTFSHFSSHSNLHVPTTVFTPFFALSYVPFSHSPSLFLPSQSSSPHYTTSFPYPVFHPPISSFFPLILFFCFLSQLSLLNYAKLDSLLICCFL